VSSSIYFETGTTEYKPHCTLHIDAQTDEYNCRGCSSSFNRVHQREILTAAKAPSSFFGFFLKQPQPWWWNNRTVKGDASAISIKARLKEEARGG
jgi:hypothetical protein